MKTSKRIEEFTHNRALHISTLATFVAGNILGYLYLGGLNFVQSWGGSFAAVIATAFLVTKSQGYWFWMIVNAGLWMTLFLHQGLPMLAWLQLSILLLSIYGMARWALVSRKIIGYLGTNLDKWGVLFATVVFVASIAAYWNMPGYRLTSWWWVEFGSVATSIAAIAMDSYRYKLNWLAWTISNAFSAPLFLHGKMWGPFVTLFMYQAINVLGWFVWLNEEKNILAEEVAENA
ncbi:MAG TPA: nicotinamide mononucleotide transporter [Candidatus Saccharimonadales bacterium]|nr:nicotinamide mononucleotide transporter [Candidatus Saccharimonadales bacterium]